MKNVEPIARNYFVRAGGEAADATQLIDWARDLYARVHGGDSAAKRESVVVTIDGDIVAHALYNPRETGDYAYITSVTDPAYNRAKNLAMREGIGDLKRMTGKPCLHVSFWDACQK